MILMKLIMFMCIFPNEILIFDDFNLLTLNIYIEALKSAGFMFYDSLIFIPLMILSFY